MTLEELKALPTGTRVRLVIAPELRYLPSRFPKGSLGSLTNHMARDGRGIAFDGDEERITAIIDWCIGPTDVELVEEPNASI